jgi:aconitate hydratase
MYREKYAEVLLGNEEWDSLDVPEGELYDWDPDSTYIREPPFFQDFPLEVPEPRDIEGARVLALLGDGITTDHISPAGAFSEDLPAGRYLMSRGVSTEDFNTYGSRRGNHEVMMRGTFANIRLRNRMVPDREGGWTRHVPSGEETPIYEAATRYIEEGTPLVVIGGREYGSGSSRDWAAKGTQLLGVRAVIAESYERIHRSNLVGMGVLPLQFKDGESASSLGLTGEEVLDIAGIPDLVPGGDCEVTAVGPDDEGKGFKVTVLLNSQMEVEYWRNGGILHKFIRDMMRAP